MRLINLILLATVLVMLQGCVGVASNVVDRRSQGTLVEDETIETKSMAGIKEKYKDSAQITITSYNRFVLITGEVPSEDFKTGIERIVYSVLGVKQIANEIHVGGMPNPSVHREDSSISRDIRSSLSRNKSIRSGTIKVTTEKGVVYLLGLVTHADANTASELASTANGVQKVVRVFEYID